MVEKRKRNEVELSDSDSDSDSDVEFVSEYRPIITKQKDLNSQPIENLEVYVDGSCLYHLIKPKAGYGIYVENYVDSIEFPKTKAYFWGRLPGKIQSSGRAEICGLIRAIQKLKIPNRRLHIFTDFISSVNLTEEYSIWKRTGENVFKYPKSDSDLWKKLLDEIDSLRYFPIISYVKGHSGNVGNDAADKYARKGALLEIESNNEQVYYRSLSAQSIEQKFHLTKSEYL